MEKCYYSKKHRIGRNLCLITAPFLSCFYLALGLFMLLDGNIGGTPEGRMLMGAGILAFDVLFSAYMALYIIWLDRTFSINEDGIRLYYAFRNHRIIRWKEISHICIRETHHGADKADSVIWCSIGAVKNQPPDMPLFADGFEYEFLHSKSVVSLEYKQERLDAVKRYYHQDIPDYRYPA